MLHGRSYYFFGDYLREKFGSRIFKLPINAGLSCPNRDGTLSSEGCIFCSEDGSAASSCSEENILLQANRAKKLFQRLDASTKYIVYFQAYSNTYGETGRLKELYDTAISVPDAIGLMIATRPDCLSDEAIELISEYDHDDFELWVEIGMQTCHDKSLKLLNRRHSNSDTETAVKRLAARGIKTCLHIILGIQGESWQDMMETASVVSSLPCSGVKLHHLHVIKNTPLEKKYIENGIPLLSLKEYVSLVCDFLERLRPDILIHRLMGNQSKESLAAPLWCLEKGTVQKAIDDEFARRHTYQGFLFNGGSF